MSVSSTLTSAVMTHMSARVIRVEPSAFWMPTTTVSPSRTGRLVTRPSKGATAIVLVQRVLVGAQVAMAWFDVPARRRRSAPWPGRARPPLRDVATSMS